MKAAVLHAVNNLRLEEVEIPKLAPNEVLIKVSLCGVCGTDIHMWAGTNFEGTFPFTPGHEWMGVVVETGKGTTSVKEGDRVAGECFEPCRKCKICKNNGIAAFCPDHR